MPHLRPRLGWPYWLGGLLAGLLSVAYLAAAGHPWGITSTWMYWVAWLAGKDCWPYFACTGKAAWVRAPWLYCGTWFNLGIVGGALLGAVLAGEFKWRWPRRRRAVVAAVLGGALMGYGARLAGGCTVGALVGGVSTLDLHGWVFAAGLFLGAWLGLGLLKRFFL